MDPHSSTINNTTLIACERRKWRFESSYCHACNFAFFEQLNTSFVLFVLCAFSMPSSKKMHKFSIVYHLLKYVITNMIHAYEKWLESSMNDTTELILYKILLYYLSSFSHAFGWDD